MSHRDLQLDRLLRSAAAAPRPAELLVELPFPVQARVLGAWRGSRAEGGDRLGLLRYFRLGLACACAVAVLTIGTTWHAVQNEPPDEIILANASADFALLQ